jgi:acetamidase/formamidase
VRKTPFAGHFHAKNDHFAKTGSGQPSEKLKEGHVSPLSVRRLTTHMGLTPMEALVVCSAAADFKIAEVVDMPKYVVTMQIPLAILPPP